MRLVELTEVGPRGTGYGFSWLPAWIQVDHGVCLGDEVPIHLVMLKEFRYHNALFGLVIKGSLG